MIEEMEKRFDACLDVIEKMEIVLEAYDSIQEEMDILEQYYAKDWIKDFEIDEIHPFSCKKGILSEDGLYDLFERYDELKKRIR